VKRWSVPRLLLTCLLSALIWAAAALLCACVGSDGRFGWPSDPQIRTLRLEPVGVASLVGAALAAAGVVYQAILRNPLADPYLLGVSSGATLFGYIWGFQFANSLFGSTLVALGQQAFSFAGALLAVGVVLVLSSRRGRMRPVTLLLVGVIVNAIAGSLFLLIDSLRPERLAGTSSAMAFLVGGIQTNLSSAQRWSAFGCATVGWILLYYLAGQLNAASVSESEAEALGLRIHRLRWIALGIASIVTASAVAISGPIGFVGLICPHLGRLIVGRDQRRLLPLATALGASLLALADAASRYFASTGKTLLPVGVLTSLLGGPFFLFLLWYDGGKGEDHAA
jgi:iron complex transport system permease protein